MKKLLFFDPFSGVTFDLLKMKLGTTFSKHYLTTTQVAFLLEGRLRREEGTIIQEESFHFVRAGKVQAPIRAKTEAILFRYFAGVPVYVLSDGSTFVTKSDGTVSAAGRLNFVGGTNSQNIMSP